MTNLTGNATKGELLGLNTKTRPIKPARNETNSTTGDIVITLAGIFTATIDLQYSTDNGSSWLPTGTQYSTAGFSVYTGNVDYLYRLSVSAYTSGTIFFSMFSANVALNGFEPVVDSTARQILCKILGGVAQQQVATQAALVNLNPSSLISVFVQGKTSAGDGGEGLFVWVAGNQSTAVTADPSKGVFVAPSSAPTGASGVWKRVYTGNLQFTWFGTNYAALVNAHTLIAYLGGATLEFDYGQTFISVPNAATIIPPANITYVGKGKYATLLKFTNPNNSQNVITQNNANVTFKDLSLQVTSATAINNEFFLWNADNLSFINCLIDGTMVSTAGSLNHTSNFIYFPDAGTRTGLKVEECTIKGCQFGIVKNNGSLAVENDVIIRNNYFTGNFLEDCTFNSPSANPKNVLITGNLFDNPLRNNAGDYRVATGGIGTGYTITDNTFNGDWGAAIHCEETFSASVISNNKGIVSRDAIFLTANNVAGVWSSPSKLIITNNNFTGALGGYHGVYIVTSGNVITTSVKDSIISNNVMSGFSTGFYDYSRRQADLALNNNIAIDCTIGFSVLYGSLLSRNNVSIRCGTGIVGFDAIVYDHTFIDCPVPVALAGGSSSPQYIYNPKFIYTNITPASPSAVSTSLMPFSANTRLDTTSVLLSLKCVTTVTGNTNYARRATLAWDGTTFTNTSVFTYGLGTFAASFANVSSNLVIQAFDGSNTGNIAQLEASFVGTMIVV